MQSRVKHDGVRCGMGLAPAGGLRLWFMLVVLLLTAGQAWSALITVGGRVVTDDTSDSLAPIGMGGVAVTISSALGGGSATTDANGNWTLSLERPPVGSFQYVTTYGKAGHTF